MLSSVNQDIETENSEIISAVKYCSLREFLILGKCSPAKMCMGLTLWISWSRALPGLDPACLN